MSSSQMRRWTRQGWKGTPLLLLLLTGCSDRPYSGPPPQQPHWAQSNTPLTSSSASSMPGGASDPLIGDTGQEPPNPLLGAVKPVPADPLLRHTKSAPTDPLIGRDPFQGHTMPTEHSHWLRGHLRDAHVTVLLNGVWYGSFSGTLDDDITMRLHRGANMVTFVYQPDGPGSRADLELLESEHDPPIAPLVTFSPSTPAGGEDTGNGSALKPVPQTFSFVAN